MRYLTHFHSGETWSLSLPVDNSWVEVGFQTSQADYQRGFLDAAEYIKSKLLKKKGIPQEAVAALDEIIGVVKQQHFSSIDEALMILE